MILQICSSRQHQLYPFHGALRTRRPDRGVPRDAVHRDDGVHAARAPPRRRDRDRVVVVVVVVDDASPSPPPRPLVVVVDAPPSPPPRRRRVLLLRLRRVVRGCAPRGGEPRDRRARGERRPRRDRPRRDDVDGARSHPREVERRGAFYLTLVPIRPRRRGERRSLRTFSPGVSLRPGSLAFDPDAPRCLSTPLLTPLNSTPTFALYGQLPATVADGCRGRPDGHARGERGRGRGRADPIERFREGGGRDHLGAGRGVVRGGLGG